MTNKNYTQMSNEELLDEIYSLNIYQGKLNAYLRIHYPELFKELVNRTNFLDDFYKEKTVPIPSRLYCLKHNLKEQPKCQNPNCDNPVEWYKHTQKFRQYCCRDCQNSDPNLQQRREITNEKRYGFKCSFQSEIVKNKFKKNFMAAHGVDSPFKLKSIRDKIKKTIQQKYNVDNFTKTEEYRIRTKQTNNRKYGTDYYSQSKIFKQKFSEMQKKSRKKWVLYWNDDKTIQVEKYDKQCGIKSNWQHHMMFDSQWEVEVFIFCKIQNNFDCEYQPNVYFEYEFNNKKSSYHPDFLINGRLYEVKGDQFFRIDEQTGEEHMFCPWRRQGLLDEEYNQICEKEDAKFKCMKENGITILRYSDIKNINASYFINDGKQN